MLFIRKKEHEQELYHKEVLIQRSQKKLVQSMDSDLKKLDRLNKILGNGIALYITSAVGRHD